MPHRPSSALPPILNTRRCTQMHFGENQLSPSLLGLSPLSTGHPPSFRLGGFGPPRGLTPASACPWIDHSASGLQHATERPVQTRFRSGSPSLVNLATHRNSLAHSSKGTPLRPRPKSRQRFD